MRKIGLFGGAFNPPHKEHIAVLDCAVRELSLTNCVVFPSFNPPHKNIVDSITFENRMDMCSLAFPNAIISDIEKQSKDRNYAVNTVKKFIEIYPNDKLFYIIGGDSMADVFKWYNPEELFSLVEIVVYPRAGRENDMEDAIVKARALGAKIHVLSYVSENVSSGEIRYLSAIGANLSDCLVKDVAEYVSGKDFYKEEVVSFVKERLSERTYRHVLRTVEWALKLNRKLSLPIDDVFYSAILHDVTKNTETNEGVPMDAISSPVAHQFSGAKVAKDLGMNENVVNAVRYHTTGRENMTLLEKLIYVADMTELGRSFDGVEKLRESLEKDFEKGFVECLSHSFEFLKKSGGNIYFLTQNAYEYYKNQ